MIMMGENVNYFISGESAIEVGRELDSKKCVFHTHKNFAYEGAAMVKVINITLNRVINLMDKTDNCVMF